MHGNFARPCAVLSGSAPSPSLGLLYYARARPRVRSSSSPPPSSSRSSSSDPCTLAGASRSAELAAKHGLWLAGRRSASSAGSRPARPRHLARSAAFRHRREPVTTPGTAPEAASVAALLRGKVNCTCQRAPTLIMSSEEMDGRSSCT